MRWSEEIGGFIADDGKAFWLPFIRTGQQAARWTQAGYDVTDAVQRHLDFLASWSSAPGFLAAQGQLGRYLRAEVEIARKSGLEGEPDLPSILRSARAFEWEPTGATG